MIKKTIILVIIGISTLLISLSCAANRETPAPSFSLTNINGNQISLSDFKGQKAVLLIFFNLQIGTGQDPTMQSYLAYYQGIDRLQVLTIVNLGDLPEEMKQYMAGQAQQSPGGLGFATPLKDEDGTVSQTFGANPVKLTIVLVDQKGNIRFRQEVTSLAETNTELVQQVEKLTK